MSALIPRLDIKADNPTCSGLWGSYTHGDFSLVTKEYTKRKTCFKDRHTCIHQVELPPWYLKQPLSVLTGVHLLYSANSTLGLSVLSSIYSPLQVQVDMQLWPKSALPVYRYDVNVYHFTSCEDS